LGRFIVAPQVQSGLIKHPIARPVCQYSPESDSNSISNSLELD
jgi:hypothetical protein